MHSKMNQDHLWFLKWRLRFYKTTTATFISKQKRWLAKYFWFIKYIKNKTNARRRYSNFLTCCEREHCLLPGIVCSVKVQRARKGRVVFLYLLDMAALSWFTSRQLPRIASHFARVVKRVRPQYLGGLPVRRVHGSARNWVVEKGPWAKTRMPEQNQYHLTELDKADALVNYILKLSRIL